MSMTTHEKLIEELDRALTGESIDPAMLRWFVREWLDRFREIDANSIAVSSKIERLLGACSEAQSGIQEVCERQSGELRRIADWLANDDLSRRDMVVAMAAILNDIAEMFDEIGTNV